MRLLVALLSTVAIAGCSPAPQAQKPAATTQMSAKHSTDKTLDQILAPARPTPSQQTRIDGVIHDEAVRWHNWQEDHRATSQQFQRDSQAAVRADDSNKVVAVRKEYLEMIARTLPRSPEAWLKVKSLFSSKQQQSLAGADQDAMFAIDRMLHHSVLHDFEYGTSSAGSECRVCHMPYYSTATASR